MYQQNVQMQKPNFAPNLNQVPQQNYVQYQQPNFAQNKTYPNQLNYSNQVNYPHNSNASIREISQNPNKKDKLNAIIVNICAGSSYDALFKSI